MAKLRARHWLAITTALVLIVVGFTFNGNDELAPVSVDLAEITTDLADQGDDVDDEALESPDELAMETESERSGPTFPLTGLPGDGDGLTRSALMVKIDNHPRARPQTGLEKADIVFEVRAEGITRFAAVFQSQLPEPVGPVRSSRTSDFDLLRGFDNPLYASSGGNDYVASGLRELPIVELTNRTRNEYFRDFSRSRPHNLYVNASDLYSLVDDNVDLPVPKPWFTYGSLSRPMPESAVAAAGPVEVAFSDSPLVSHEWDDAVSGWLRSQDRSPHVTADGDQLAPENVVIMVTDYSTSPADPISPEVRSTGSGEAVVLTAGHIIRGTWERPMAESKPTLLDGNGEPIVLTTGRTWVLMPENGQVEFDPGQSFGADLSSSGDNT